MTKKFKSEEKNYLRLALIETGAELFQRYGFQKTTISDITKKVGIAQGSFYHFFKSKELLYFSVLENEEEKLRTQFMNLSPPQDGNRKIWLKKTLGTMFKEIETNPLLKELIGGETIKFLLRKLSPDQLDNHFLRDISFIETWFKMLDQSGLRLTINSELFASWLRALLMQSLHKKEIGEDMFDELIDLQIDLFVDGLFDEGA